MKLPLSTPIWLQRLLDSPGDQLTRWQRAVRYAMDLAWYCAKELKHDKAEEMAAALTYRTIFSLIPIVVVSFVVFNADGFEELRVKAQANALHWAGLTNLSFDGDESATLDEAGQKRVTLNNGTVLIGTIVETGDQWVVLDDARVELPVAVGRRDSEQRSVMEHPLPGRMTIPADQVQEIKGVGAPPSTAEVPATDVETRTGSVADEAVGKAQPQTQGERDTANLANRTLVIESINRLVEKIEDLDFASIGAIGFILLIYTALSLVIAMEHSFNQIFGAAEGRSFGMRVMLYWSALTLGPVLLLASAYTAGQFTGEVVEFEKEQHVTLVSPVLGFLGRFASLGASWLLLFFLYARMPNTRVLLRPAAVGAFVAAVLWEFAKFGFALYVRTALPYSVLYGSLALIPLFLFWVYLTWLIILFGLELTYTLQHMKGRRFKHEAHKQVDDQLIDTAWLLPIATRIAQAFQRGRAIRVDELSQAMCLPPRSITKMLCALEQAQVVHRVIQDGDHEAVSLAQPADRIPVANVFKAGQSLLPNRESTPNGDAAWKFLDQLRTGNRDLLETTTLADLCDPPPEPGKPEAIQEKNAPTTHPVTAPS